ncbi:(-)-5-epieremophilene synthase STPS1 [Sesamum angolense]|uniref:(-)-5-epieremophilene synthase STPS1 n=1 Tax=Sesamum angolense TaxID=2727404 RepID=A0AAE1W754_9LAMI|nr:(-)-5-epieremophilene synthase STPS1 [Sesamum angolense]
MELEEERDGPAVAVGDGDDDGGGGMERGSREEFEWLSQKPKMLVAGLTICRVIDDIATYEVEKERGQIATGIECYMKENRVTKEEAVNKFFEIATNAWKDINEECLRPSSCSRDVLMRILNLERIIDVCQSYLILMEEIDRSLACATINY